MPQIFDTTNCRRYFRRVLARQAAAKRTRMQRARQAKPTPRTPRAPVPGPPPVGDVLTATQAMQWLGLGPTPFYAWRNQLGIRPLRKAVHQALYARRDVVRIATAYLRGRHYGND